MTGLKIAGGAVLAVVVVVVGVAGGLWVFDSHQRAEGQRRVAEMQAEYEQRQIEKGEATLREIQAQVAAEMAAKAEARLGPDR